jgi:hypothetical protein
MAGLLDFVQCLVFKTEHFVLEDASASFHMRKKPTGNSK